MRHIWRASPSYLPRVYSFAEDGASSEGGPRGTTCSQIEALLARGGRDGPQETRLLIAAATNCARRRRIRARLASSCMRSR